MRDRRGRLFRCKSRSNTGCDNSRYRTVSQIGRESRKATVLGLCPAIFNFHVLAFDIAEFAETGSKCGQERRIGPGKPAAQKSDHRHRRLLRARRQRPRHRRAAECGQQFPPSDDDRHTPLPCEVRKGNDTTPRACSLHVQGGRMLVLPPLSSASTALLPPPALCERSHRGLARRRVAMSWRPIFTLPEGQCPHPRRTDRRRVNLHDTTDDDALGEHLEIIFVPLAEGPAGRCAFKDEVVLFHPWAVTVRARRRSALPTTTTLAPSLVHFPSQRTDAVRVHF